MALFTEFDELIEERIEFGAGRVAPTFVDETGMTGRLTQAEKRLKHLKPVAGPGAGVRLAKQFVAVVTLQFVVLLALFAFQFAIDGLFRFLGKLAGNLLFGTAQDERPERLGEHEPRIFARVLGQPSGGAQDAGLAEHTGIEKLEEAPELAQVVLHGRAAEGETVVRLEQTHGLRGCGGGVLDGLRFVEDYVVEG